MLINYLTLADETDFESSKMWDKAKNIILVYYYDDQIGARAHHLAARQRLGQTIGARTRIRCGDAPAGLII